MLWSNVCGIMLVYIIDINLFFNEMTILVCLFY